MPNVVWRAAQPQPHWGISCPTVRECYIKEGTHIDSCLNYIYKTLKENKPNHLEIFADLEDCKINGGTVPPDVTLTGSRPDLVLVDRQSKKVSLIELTITWDTTANTDAARDRKQARYAYLKEDIEERGFHCFNNPLEIGTRAI